MSFLGSIAILQEGSLFRGQTNLANYLYSSPGTVGSVESDLRARLYGTASGKLVAAPSDTTKVTVTGGWSRDRQKPTTGIWLDDPGFPRNAFNPLPETQTETAHFGLTLEHDLEWARLTSVTGFQHYETELEADIVDGFIGTAQTGLPGFALQMPGLNVRRIDEHSNQWTQELRLDGETEGGTRWLAGISGLASTFNSTTDITSLQLANGAYRGRIDTVNIALFGEVTVPLTERLDWIGGLRLSHERKEFEGTFRGRNGARAYFSENGDEDYTFATGRTGFTYALADNMTAFATVARGEKTGGYLFYNQFAAMGMPLTPYDSASTWSYEAGLKATDLGGFLTLGTSLFYNDTSDEQLFTFNPVLGRFSVLNADTRSYGLEIEAKAQATETMAFSANLALLDAEIDGGANPAIIGNDVPYAPVFTASLAADYRRELDLAGLSGSGFVRAEYLYTGSRQIDPANSRKLDGYGLVNLRAGWQKGNIDIYASVENLFDKRYVSSAFQAGTSTTGSAVFAGIPGEGRTFTLGARVKF